ncbi:hypothetical protein WA026_008158 [Henosepilachna vigintioctopunctata]|uniref:EF-hand domain-containing protein n=1 Tax=Henosepilachna vigintioctopunctata TaxID=420089 RepID=A0AAW1TIM9_9CUCU
MAYEGKFRDSCPIICAAGIKNKPNHSVGESLQHYTLEDGIQALKSDFHVPEKEYKPTKLPKISANSRSCVLTESREILRPPDQTRYRQLITDLKESTYESYWKKNLGTPIDSVPAFPEGMKVEEHTFGKPNVYDVTVKDLIQPPQDPYQVIQDACQSYYSDKGKASTLPEETKAFGTYYGYDKRGLKVKCLLHAPPAGCVRPISKIQVDWRLRNANKLGKCSRANDILETLPDGHVFGIPYRRSMYTVEDLLREPNAPVSCEVRDIRSWLVSLNRLKMQIRRKFDYCDTLYETLKSVDKDNVGYISFSQLLENMRCLEIFFNIPNIKALMEYLQIIVNDKVDYVKFLDSVTGRIVLDKISDLSSDQIYLTSTYQDICRDYFLPDENVGRPVAGLPSLKTCAGNSVNPYSENYVQLSDHTDVKACLQPSILTQFSLSHRDFFCTFILIAMTD